jgi:6-phosphogluconolactonase
MACPTSGGAAWFPLAIVLPLAWAVAPALPAAEPKMDKLWVYVGTYTQKESKGIYRFQLDPATGNLTGRALAAEAKNPSFVAIHPNHRFLYAVSEVENLDGKRTGGVSAFAIDPGTGDLRRLNEQPSGGAGPCHLVVDRAGKHVLVANYGGGSASVLPIEPDGRLGKATAFVQHQGSGPNPRRQEGPHAHSINLDAADRFAVVADLGLDKVFVYRFDPLKGTLTANDPPSVSVAPSPYPLPQSQGGEGRVRGAGPRHFAFHPNNRNAYVINEIASMVTAFRYDAERGVLEPLQTVSTLPKGFSGNNSTAEVQVHPSGKFLYGSNRGHNSIAIFAIDPMTGRLSPVGHQSDQIKTPRNFGIDPTGSYLLVANQDSDSIVVFRIDPQTGELRPTGTRVEVPIPVCVKMMPIPR